MATKAFQKIYTKITQITKATCSLKATGVGYDELATVNGKLAQVVKIAGDEVTLQVFEGTEGIPTNAEVVFLGKAPTIKVSEQLAGRFFNAFGDPIDGGPAIEGEEVEIGGPSVNPVRRKQPSELIATGIAGIDLNNTLVSGHQRIVQVDTCNTGCNQFRGLLTAHRIHGWTANFHLLAFNGRTTVDGVAKGVEEASGKLLAHFDCRSLAQEYYLCIGGNTFRTLKHLQSHFVAGNLHHLGQLAVYGRQLVIPHSGCLQRTRSFRNLSNLGIYFLKCFCCHLFIYNLAIYYLLFKSLPSYSTIFLSTTSVHLHPQGK